MPRVRNRLFYIIFLVLPTTVVRAEESAVPLENDAAKASYELGYSFAGNIEREFGEYIDQAAFMAGSRDALAGQPKRISDTDAKSAYARLTELRVERVKAEGARFLAENGAREGVVTLPSGLQYEILTPGEGPKPTTTDRVKTHYEGRLVDGTVFDSSYRRGEPATFPLNAVIKGWTEGLQLMQVGAKWRLFIPSDLGYGERGAGQSIPPNATLVFDVELLEILGPG